MTPAENAFVDRLNEYATKNHFFDRHGMTAVLDKECSGVRMAGNREKALAIFAYCISCDLKLDAVIQRL